MKVLKGILWFIFFLMFAAIFLETIWNFMNITLPILLASVGTTDVWSAMLYFFSTLFGGTII